jgi:dipeptidyl aminopeptidase/acylaminoacyl peptidase
MGSIDGGPPAERPKRGVRDVDVWVEPWVALVVVTGLTVVAYLALCATLYDRITRVPAASPFRDPPNTPARFAAAEVDVRPYLMPDYDEVGFPDRTGAVGIAAWWVPVEGQPDAPAVVVVHGFTASRGDGSVLLAAGMLHRNGFACLIIDLRNHGDSGRSGGRHTGGIRESADVLGAWDWLVLGRHLPSEQIGLLGISLGAASVVIAAGDEPKVAAVWSDSSYGELDDATRAELRRNHLPGFLLPGGRLIARLLDGPGLQDTSPVLAVRRLDGRALFVTHGTDDDRLDARFADQLALAGVASGARVETWVVPGSGHASAIVDRPAEYEQRLVDFFDRALRT